VVTVASHARGAVEPDHRPVSVAVRAAQLERAIKLRVGRMPGSAVLSVGFLWVPTLRTRTCGDSVGAQIAQIKGVSAVSRLLRPAHRKALTFQGGDLRPDLYISDDRRTEARRAGPILVDYCGELQRESPGWLTAKRKIYTECPPVTVNL
jgi:hypothetical protein